MDVNIITFHREYNYGAMLQAYALQEFISRLGHDAGVYDYIRPEAPAGGLRQRTIDALCRLNRKDCRAREAKYTEFCETYLRLNRDDKRSAFVTGSDQVWNPEGELDAHYFLRFVPSSSRKLSYAASLGVPEIPEEKKALFRQYIADFDAVSVREEQAKACVSELWEKEISVNVDPTLLHGMDFWKTIENPVPDLPERYNLVYLMHLPRNINTLLAWLKQQTGYDTVVLDGQGAVQGVLANLVKHDKAVHRAGPREFVWLVDHAQCVATSSFHGTAFSLIFEKEFYAITDSPTSRISNILQKCGLSSVSESDDRFVRSSDVDWGRVAAALKNERARSAAYFNEVL